MNQDINKTVEEAPIQLNVVDGLDMGMHEKIQDLLNPVYEHFPFTASTIFGIPLANLLAAAIVFMFFLVLRHVFANIVTVSLQELAKKTPTFYDNRVISALRGPISFSFILVGAHLFFLLIFMETEFIKNVLSTFVVYTVFWGILATSEALRGLFYEAVGKVNKELSVEIGNFILAIWKVLVVGMGLGGMMQVWGINVTALVASLGVGGLAFALAAKDTAANLFGSFSLLADKSIRIGEWIKVNGVEGTVEELGMRTTKIRSFEKSVITVPNHIVANNPIENFSRRGVRRIKMHIGLTYSTTSDQVSSIVSQIKEMLSSHEGISQKETLLVNFDKFGESSLDIFVYTFTDTSVWSEYLETREDVNMKIMKIVEDNGSSFAFPSRSIYIEQN